MRLLAETGYSFHGEGSKSFIEHFILASKRPRIQEVIERIGQEKQLKALLREKNRLKQYKHGKRFRKERGSIDKK
jgi:hypothetical protein